jgi:transcription initiation factor TFIIIB Brf1 subunit/transcription initiation factor TFIIB
MSKMAKQTVDVWNGKCPKCGGDQWEFEEDYQFDAETYACECGIKFQVSLIRHTPVAL